MLDHHRAMLADTVRMDAYAAAIRAVVKPGDVVLDIGTGTGILAFLACRAGARHAYAIDATHAADVAMLLARHYGLADRVTVFHEHSTSVELPERANVLVTEILGAFALEERILPTIVDARRRLLTPDALLIPRRIVLSLVPVEQPALIAKHVDAWNEPRAGFDFSLLRTFAANTWYVDAIDPASHLATPQPAVDIDLTTIDAPDVGGTATFVATRDGIMHGFAGWFAATLADGVELSNAIPRATCWDQAFLPLEQPVAIAKGTAIRVELQSDGRRAWRWRGAAGATAFDQTTWLDRPPCGSRVAR